MGCGIFFWPVRLQKSVSVTNTYCVVLLDLSYHLVHITCWRSDSKLEYVRSSSTKLRSTAGRFSYAATGSEADHSRSQDCTTTRGEKGRWFCSKKRNFVVLLRFDARHSVYINIPYFSYTNIYTISVTCRNIYIYMICVILNIHSDMQWFQRRYPIRISQPSFPEGALDTPGPFGRTSGGYRNPPEAWCNQHLRLWIWTCGWCICTFSFKGNYKFHSLNRWKREIQCTC